MIDRTWRRVGAAAIGAAGAIHLLLTPEYFGQQPYIGVLFALGGIAAVAIAAALWARDRATWWALGELLCAGMALGFIASRTVGLPGFQESEWELSGIVSLLLEAGFIALASSALASHSARFQRESESLPA
ncbi:MAG: hypothetical protein U0R52_02090 [Solirubrobacterales bacterium]